MADEKGEATDEATDRVTDEATRALANTDPGKELDLSHLGLNHIMTLAQIFYASGVFTDVKSEAQARVKILAGQEVGLPPIYSMQHFHLISVTNQKTNEQKTSLATSAETMGLLLKRTKKYDYRILKHDDEECSIMFKQLIDGEWVDVYTSTFTKKDAIRAGIWRVGGAWEKYPRAMNFSRAMSQGCRVVGPDAGGPKYTPEEIESITPDILTEGEGPPNPDKPRGPRRRARETAPVTPQVADQTKALEVQKEPGADDKVVAADEAFAQLGQGEDTEGTPPGTGKPPAEVLGDFKDVTPDKATGEAAAGSQVAGEAPKPTTRPLRDHKTVGSLQELYRACQDDFGIDPDKVMDELGVKTNMEIVKAPWECYLQIAAVYKLKEHPAAKPTAETAQ